MLVSERPWCDFVSYSGGLPMAVVRVHADTAIQDAIIDAASEFERPHHDDQGHGRRTAGRRRTADRHPLTRATTADRSSPASRCGG
jgi:hypothetical protein